MNYKNFVNKKFMLFFISMTMITCTATYLNASHIGYRLKWKIRTTGKIYKGAFFEKKWLAQSWADHSNKKYPDSIYEWVEKEYSTDKYIEDKK